MKNNLVFFLLVLALNTFGQDVRVYHSLQEAFNDSTNVRSLDLSENNLMELPVEILHLKNLEDIDLEANPKLNFNQAINLLSRLEKLKILGLGRNNLSNLPEEISKLKNLEYLSLEENNFSQIPESVKKLKITSLYLFDNKIKKLEIKNGDLEYLENINLCYNEFDIFPVELSVIPKLKKITMWYCHLKSIPAGIKKFKRIEDIIIDHNELTGIPVQIGDLRSLRNLILGHNQLTAEGIMPVYKMKGLKELGLNGNKIDSLSSQIRELKNLEHLDVSENPLVTLPNEFAELNKLEQLGLGELHNFDWEYVFTILSKMPNLRKVGMYRMRLQKMPSGFERLRQVDTFWLNQNTFDKQERDRLVKLLPKAKLEFN